MRALPLLFPLAGFVLNLGVGRRLSPRLVSLIGCSTVLASFLLYVLFSLESDRAFGETVLWRFLDEPRVVFALHHDPLVLLFSLVVTGVGFLIHVFSTGYMSGQPRYNAYFAQLNLFVFSMLLLVSAENLLLLFFGWELVGLCSYLLIGFWFGKPAAAAACRKAFWTNRLGDIGFLFGLLLAYKWAGTLSFPEIFAAGLEREQRAVVSLFLFVGAMGKSAQFPLYIWLPDAMEGPTPVSALIHAATMVTAGIFMILRLAPLFGGTWTMAIIAYAGVFTALYAALVACFQQELKKVLAFSTVSQLGLMALSCGTGGFGAAAFHFTTHAFFKSLLFLGTGAVMHATCENQELHRLGGLRRRMPLTYYTMLVGVLALAGIFPFSGFFSKDGLLHAGLTGGNFWLYLAAQGASALTAFYSGRFLFLTFFGTYKGEGDPHDPGLNMTVPLFLLACLAFAGGLINLPLGSFAFLERFLDPLFPQVHHEQGILPLVVMGVSLATGVVSLMVAYWVYVKAESARAALYTRLQPLAAFLAADGLQQLLVAPILALARLLAEILWIVGDLVCLDGLVAGVGRVCVTTGERLRGVVSGLSRNYLAMVALSFVLILLLLGGLW